ncbi:MAG: hypothetical protein HY881_09190 [Deltaproteobacteria bacterium]|nr:hypothetical protein [Deltaproteobacteria bacterium]
MGRISDNRRKKKKTTVANIRRDDSSDCSFKEKTGFYEEETEQVGSHIPLSEAGLLNQRGEDLAAAGQYEEAVEHFQRAAGCSPDWVVPVNNIGVACWQIGDSNKAMEWIKKAFVLNPDHRETVLNFIEMLTQMESEDLAFAVAQSYLKRHPDAPEIKARSGILRPSIRIIHHMARSGGTIMCKCLGCMNDVLLLSEVHPLGMQWFDPLTQAAEWYHLFFGDELDELKALNLSFLQKIVRIYARAVELNRHLVLRDWSHLDFTAVPFVQSPSYSLTTATVLESQFNIVRLTTVRHPIDQWLSLSRLAVMNGRISIDAFLRGYCRFAECAKEIGFIRYEDFTRDPEWAMHSVCSLLDLKYDDSFLSKWSTYRSITGDTRSQRGPDDQIKSMPRRPVDQALLKQFEVSKDYWTALGLLGYEHP